MTLEPRPMRSPRRYGDVTGNRPAPGGESLADILERVLDKGIVIAGDIQINLLDIELLTIKLRLLVASVDRAKEMGIDWWETDPSLSSGTSELEEENRMLRERLDRLERRLGAGDEGQSDEEAPAESSGQEEEKQPARRSRTARRRSG
jgi:hypothetical protein